ncbi:NPCBM/NEW2 domain-containing protein, partial [Deinococcus sp.]|uniref:NPCBM/NEW2 domain-containing protein n=1 Tax=Deinococcus sp. TaxID=47478 RepID=UPI0028698EC1
MRPRPTLAHLLTGLALLTLQVACSQGPGAHAPPAVGEPLAPLTLGPGTNTLQYEPFLSATNGWGPVERNRSNGEQAAGDGKTLTLHGTTYAQGFGVHASSDLRFALPVSGVACTRLLADVGVDDEVGAKGSVVFQVYLDGVRAFDSGTMTGSSATRQVDLDVTGRRELRLSVTDAGNGTSYDHGDWANPRLVCVSAVTPPPPPPVPGPAPVRHLEYVGVNGALKVYDIDHGYALVRTIPLPGVYNLRGIVASAVTDRLYVPYTGDRADAKYAGQPSFGYLLALDLKTDRVLWTRKYSPSV